MKPLQFALVVMALAVQARLASANRSGLSTDPAAPKAASVFPPRPEPLPGTNLAPPFLMAMVFEGPSHWRATNHLHVLSLSKYSIAVGTNQPRPSAYVARLSDDFDLVATNLAKKQGVRKWHRLARRAAEGQEASFAFTRRDPPQVWGLTNGGAYGVFSSPWGPEAYEAILQLSVTPFVGRDTFITMVVHQTLANYVADCITIQNVGDVFVSESIDGQVSVTLHDGETLLLGGLTLTQKTPWRNKFAILDRYPRLLGLLHKWMDHTEHHEIVVLLRPAIPIPDALAPAPRREPRP